MMQRLLLFISLVLCPLDLAWAEDWPQWRGPDRTGVSKEKGLLESWPAKGPKLLWTFRDAGIGYSCMAVVGERLYSMGAEGNKEYVYAIDLKTQKKLWSTEVGASLILRGAYNGPRGTPTIDGNSLYTVGFYGDLVCVETNSGKKVWSQAMKTILTGESRHYGYCESPLVDGDLLIATPGGDKGALAAFDKKTGALKWRSTECTYSTAYSSISAIEVGGIRQYVQVPGSETGVGDHVVGVRAADGKLLWKFPFRYNVATPICRDDCVYVSSLNGCKLVKLVPDGGKCKAEPIYANKEMKNHLGGVVLVDGYLYGYSKKGAKKGITCQDFKTGKAVWFNEGGGSGSVSFADGNLYCYHANPCGVLRLVKATPAGYKEQGTLHIPERSKLENEVTGESTFTQPVVANGKLYLRDQELIFCYDIRKLR